MEMGNREGEQKTFTAVGALCSGVRKHEVAHPTSAEGSLLFFPPLRGRGGEHGGQDFKELKAPYH